MLSTLSLIRVMFANRQRTIALSSWTASFSLGGLLAPVIAGSLVERFWWGSVILVAGHRGAAAGARPVPASRNEALPAAARHRVRRDQSGGRAVGGLRPQAHRQPGPALDCRHRPGALLGAPFVRLQSAATTRWSTSAYSGAPRSAWRWPQHPVVLRAVRQPAVDRPVPPGGARAVSAAGRHLHDPVRPGLPPWRDDRPGGRPAPVLVPRHRRGWSSCASDSR